MFSQKQEFFGPFPLIIERKSPYPLRVQVFISILVEQSSKVTALFITRDDDVTYTKTWAEVKLGKQQISYDGYSSPLTKPKKEKRSTWYAEQSLERGDSIDNRMRMEDITNGLIVVGGDEPIKNPTLRRFISTPRFYELANRATIYLQKRMLGNSQKDVYYDPERLNGEETLRNKLKEALQAIVSYKCPKITFQDLDRVFSSTIYKYDQIIPVSKVKVKRRPRSQSETERMSFSMPEEVSIRKARIVKPKKDKVKIDNPHMKFSFG